MKLAGVLHSNHVDGMAQSRELPHCDIDGLLAGVLQIEPIEQRAALVLPVDDLQLDLQILAIACLCRLHFRFRDDRDILAIWNRLEAFIWIDC